MKEQRKKIFLLLLFCYGQICFIVSLRTQVFAIVQKDFQLNYNHIAILVLVSGILTQTSAYFSGNFIQKIGYKKSLNVAITTIIISFGGMFFVDTPWLFDALFTLFMIGNGAATLVLNMYTGVLLPEKRGKALVILHLGASIGLCIGPKTMDMGLRLGLTWQWVCGLAVIPLIVILLISIYVKEPSDLHIIKEEKHSKLNGNKKVVTQIGIATVAYFVLIFACAQVWEFGIGTWFVIYAQKGKGLSTKMATNYLTIFLICFPIARILYMKMINYLPGIYCLCLSFVLNGFLCMLAILTGNILFFALTGVFTSLFYPIMMAIMQDVLGDRSTKLIGFICMIGGFIQYIFIWLVGVLGDYFSITVGFYSLSVYLILGAILTYGLINHLKLAEVKITT